MKFLKLLSFDRTINIFHSPFDLAEQTIIVYSVSHIFANTDYNSGHKKPNLIGTNKLLFEG